MSLELKSFVREAGQGRSTIQIDPSNLPAMLEGNVTFRVAKASAANGGGTFVIFTGPTGKSLSVRVKYEDDKFPTTVEERDAFVVNQLRNYNMSAGVSDATKYSGQRYIVFGKKAESDNLPVGSLEDVLKFVIGA